MPPTPGFSYLAFWTCFSVLYTGTQIYRTEKPEKELYQSDVFSKVTEQDKDVIEGRDYL